MFISVKEIVSKCTEREEGEALFEACEKYLSQENIRISFNGIGNVTEDFLFGFLGNVKKYLPEKPFKNLHYVRIESHILRRIKSTCKALGD